MFKMYDRKLLGDVFNHFPCNVYTSIGIEILVVKFHLICYFVRNQLLKILIKTDKSRNRFRP